MPPCTARQTFGLPPTQHAKWVTEKQKQLRQKQQQEDSQCCHCYGTKTMTTLATMTTDIYSEKHMLQLMYLQWNTNMPKFSQFHPELANPTVDHKWLHEDAGIFNRWRSFATKLHYCYRLSP
jgi:hypothetical protein